MQYLLKRSIQSDYMNKRLLIERGSSILILLIVLCFIITWTPYAAISMYSAFIDSNRIEPLLGTSLALFTKSSMLWPPILCILSNRKIRHGLFRILEIIQYHSTTPSVQEEIRKSIQIFFSINLL
jgi:hypothetical protein